MRAVLCLSLAVVVAALGCGGEQGGGTATSDRQGAAAGQGTPGRGAADLQSAADRRAAVERADYLISRKAVALRNGLLPGARPDNENTAVSAPCNPFPALQNAQTSESPVFRLRHSRVQQVVGVFPGVEAAQRSVARLGSAARKECIEESLTTNVAQRLGKSGPIERQPPQRLPFGDQAVLLSFVMRIPGSSDDPRTSVVLLRVGRSVTDILFGAQGEEIPDSLVTLVTREADRRLAAAQD